MADPLFIDGEPLTTESLTKRMSELYRGVGDWTFNVVKRKLPYTGKRQATIHPSDFSDQDVVVATELGVQRFAQADVSEILAFILAG